MALPNTLFAKHGRSTVVWCACLHCGMMMTGNANGAPTQQGGRRVSVLCVWCVCCGCVGMYGMTRSALRSSPMLLRCVSPCVHVYAHGSCWAGWPAGWLAVNICFIWVFRPQQYMIVCAVPSTGVSDGLPLRALLPLSDGRGAVCLSLCFILSLSPPTVHNLLHMCQV